MDKQILALIAEREGYLARGLVERVEAVDMSLKELGYKVIPVEIASIEPAPERAIVKRGKRKRAE